VIVGSYVELPDGFRGFGMSDGTGQFHPGQPFMVIRRATYEEYVASCEEAGVTPDLGVRLDGSYFYLVSVD
jgi:hypothetical protein